MARDLFLPLDSRIEVSRLEEANDLSGYTIDSLELLKKMYSGQELAMLVGEDTLTSFHKWKDSEKILAQVCLYVAPTRKVGQRVFLLPTSFVQASTLSSRDIIAPQSDL